MLLDIVNAVTYCYNFIEYCYNAIIPLTDLSFGSRVSKILFVLKAYFIGCSL